MASCIICSKPLDVDGVCPECIQAKDLVQCRNPRSNRYILIDRDKGHIIGRKDEEGPYKGITIVGKEV